MATPLGITLPIQRGQNGYFTMTTDLRTQLKSNIINLLLTKKGERLMNPSFGSDLYSVIFEPQTDDGLANVNGAITDAIKTWMPFLSIDNINIQRDPDNNKIFVQLTFHLTTATNVTDVVTLVF